MIPRKYPALESQANPQTLTVQQGDGRLPFSP